MSMQDLLRMLVDRTGLQTNAQQGLPVTPNNGNPGGAHNMPWMQPSPYMAQIQQMLQQRWANGGSSMPSGLPPLPVRQMQTGGGMQQEPLMVTKPLQIGGPVMPQTGGVLPPEQVGNPVLPARRGMPSFAPDRNRPMPTFNPNHLR